ncbi:MAG: hypothetical protein IKV54_08040 [Clostridia bacterium]|nr:hypothetical protein [Clostridia bacterium]
MEEKNTAVRTYTAGVLTSAVFALAASILYIIAYHNSYDTVIRHFNIGAVLPYVFGSLMAASAIAFTVTSLLMRKKCTFEAASPKSAETFGLWMCGLMFLIFGVLSFSAEPSANAAGLGALCTKALAPLAIVSAVPFFLRSSSYRNGTLHAVSTFAPVLWGICIMFKYYFDLKEMPLNDPELTLTMVSISSAVIFFLCECRLALGIATPSVAAFSASAAACLTGSISVARAVLWRMDGHVIPAPTETLLLLSVAILAGCRLFELSGAFAPVVNEEITEEESEETSLENGDAVEEETAE